MSIKCLIFDLDDTIYPEYQFVFSGYRAVGARTKLDFGIDISEALVRRFESGQRGDLFSPTLKDNGIRVEEKYVRSTLVEAYRQHHPDIRPYRGFEKLRLFFQRWTLGMLTDGISVVQNRKVDALNVRELFSSIVVSSDLGADKGKPSPEGYLKVLSDLKCSPASAVYIADNPTKDFNFPASSGMHSIHLINQAENPFLIHSHLRAIVPADKQCFSFDELEVAILSL